jgi:hypothetical protein
MLPMLANEKFFKLKSIFFRNKLGKNSPIKLAKDRFYYLRCSIINFAEIVFGRQVFSLIRIPNPYIILSGSFLKTFFAATWSINKYATKR